MRLLFLLLIIAGAMQPVSSQVLSNNEIDVTVFALIIGISDYEHISDLKYAHVDAEAMKTYIEKAFPTSQSTVLTDSSATRKNIVTALANILTEVNSGDTVLIYFSGHGDCESRLKGDPGFLLSYDSPNNNYLISAIRVDELKSIIESYIEKNKAKVILFVDACRAGSISENNQQGPGKTTASLMNLFQNEILFLACKPDQRSLEQAELKHGLFTYFLFKGFSGAADGNGDQNLTVEELRRYLFDEVMKASQNAQTPIVQGDPLALVSMAPKLDEAISFTAQDPPRSFNRPNRKNEENRKATSSLLEQDNSKEDTIDQYEKLLHLFQNAIDNGRLIQPKDSCALHYFRLYPSHSVYEKNKKKMQVMLLESLLENSSDFLMGYTSDPEFYPTEKVTTEALGHLEAGLSELLSEDYSFKKFKSRTLFFKAFQNRYSLEPNWIDAVELLDSALIYEPMGAYIYNELGNIYYNQLLDSPAAAEQYEEALSITPSWEIPISGLANIKLDISSTTASSTTTRVAIMGEWEFTFPRCYRFDDSVVCEFRVTNNTRDGTLYLYKQSRAFDYANNEYTPYEFKIAGIQSNGFVKKMIIKDLEVLCTITFLDVPKSVESFNLLKLRFQGGDSLTQEIKFHEILFELD
ncbi:MAG: caspase family protein [Chitinophagales bacterium]|nr:caspase family protein [Chitinophagales bacterium]